MIFDSLKLQNFGVYQGTQIVQLTPEAGKPIILFGGMNGGGKTTMLDAIQLALYGPRARISNRGPIAYKDYLREAMNRSAPDGATSGVTLEFRRFVDGVYQSFRITRSWKLGEKGVEEQMEVIQNGAFNPEITTHWDETIDAYLPSSIAHLFFFDGEQIMDLAEPEHASEILRTAIYSLLGLDLVERLESDLKVFERRKRAEELDETAAAELAHLRAQIEKLDSEHALLTRDEGALSNQLTRLNKEIAQRELHFRAEGGGLYDQRAEIDRGLESLRYEKARAEGALRDLVGGILPLAMLRPQISALRQLADKEADFERAQTLVSLLDRRDNEVLAKINESGLSGEALACLSEILAEDRSRREAAADGTLFLKASRDFRTQVEFVENTVLTTATQHLVELTEMVTTLDEQILRVERDLERVPSTERIDAIKAEMAEVRAERDLIVAESITLQSRQAALAKARQSLMVRLDRNDQAELDYLSSKDDKARFLRHSAKVRETLAELRACVVCQHVERMQGLILDAFRQLLRKPDLISDVGIDPDTFNIVLKDANRRALPVSRLSAGERQLLATALLWGLAKASGRPIPTMIDTPLGRLDSTHRMHLASRYFSSASHQVLLLSTDEELVGDYLSAIAPFVTRSYMLRHDDRSGVTRIELGYFQ